MSKELAPGLVRLTYRGAVYQRDYNFATKTIGPVRVTLPHAYACPYFAPASRWTRHDMWKALVEDSSAIAVILLNNVFLITVTPAYLRIREPNDRRNDQIAVSDARTLFIPTIPIGFLRTVPEVLDVDIPPYVLYMDKLHRILDASGGMRILPDAVECTDISLYKTLITTPNSAVYQTEHGVAFL